MFKYTDRMQRESWLMRVEIGRERVVDVSCNDEKIKGWRSLDCQINHCGNRPVLQNLSHVQFVAYYKSKALQVS